MVGRVTYTYDCTVKVRAFKAGKVCFPKVSLTGRRSLGEIGEDGGRGYEV